MSSEVKRVKDCIRRETESHDLYLLGLARFCTIIDRGFLEHTRMDRSANVGQVAQHWAGAVGEYYKFI